MYWQRQVPLSDWEISGDFHIWQQSTEEECSFSIYVILALTFGYTMIVAEICTRTHDEEKARLGAYQVIWKSRLAVFWRLDQCDHSDADRAVLFRYRWLGTSSIWQDMLWDMGQDLAADGYFSGTFISNGVSTEICFASLYCMFTLVIIYAGVRNGIERVSKLMMPVLIVLSVIICRLFRDKTGSNGRSEVFPDTEF